MEVIIKIELVESTNNNTFHHKIKCVTSSDSFGKVSWNVNLVEVQ
jgi:hypothetical protein